MSGHAQVICGAPLLDSRLGKGARVAISMVLTNSFALAHEVYKPWSPCGLYLLLADMGQTSEIDTPNSLWQIVRTAQYIGQGPCSPTYMYIHVLGSPKLGRAIARLIAASFLWS